MQAVVITSMEQLSEVLQLRREVFIEEQGIPEELEMDGKEKQSTHVGIFEEQQLIACGRLTPVNSEEAVLSRIAVSKPFRSKGLGILIIKQLEKEAGKSGYRKLSLKPHTYLEKFYHSLGYEKVKDVEIVGEHPLILMEKKLHHSNS